MEQFLTALLVVGVLVIYLSFSWGLVAFKFYGWFVLPYFEGLPEFSITHFVGFILFIGVMTHKSSTHLKKEFEDEGMKMVSVILGPWITLFCGWLMYALFF
jgi:hypothetical protein